MAVVNQIRLIVLEFGRKPEGIGLGHWSGHAQDFSEGAFEASLQVFAMALAMRPFQSKT